MLIKICAACVGNGYIVESNRLVKTCDQCDGLGSIGIDEHEDE